MRMRALGTQGLVVSEIGLGCMGMTYAYGPADEAEAIATVHRAIELGCTFLDTAEIYGPHTNELLLGKALKGRRDQVTLATKFGFRIGEDGRPAGLDSSAANVKRACEASLKRLGTDHVELYYQHRVDPEVPIEETVTAMADLVREGKVRYLGLSEAGPANLRRASRVHPISALQSEYSLWTRDPEDGVLATCRELGIGLVAYSPLGRGFLTGTLRSPDDLPDTDWRRTHPRFQAESMELNAALAASVEELAAKKGCAASQLALAWVMSRGPDIVPIPGTKRRKWLEENLGAADVTLTVADLEWLDERVPKGAAVGERYTEAMLKAVDTAR
ncbi:MAG: aldo/keto reductase [Candidatus Eisenbacteria bacterium]|uniref:Aldo/keto reductase n=1 Tax=Eiseniibacteriota bacterium TaxID=2212470 RepID=A0A849SJS6_UNCEI|nr:aldo/keto reductase [Candidatus Eisenbacteria bacterium]